MTLDNPETCARCRKPLPEYRLSEGSIVTLEAWLNNPETPVIAHSRGQLCHRCSQDFCRWLEMNP